MSVFRGASVGVTLTANKSRYSKELKEARRELKQWQDTSRRSAQQVSRALKATAAVGAAAIGTGLVLAIRDGVDELNAMQQATAQTAAGIKSTGNAANVSVKGIENRSAALMRMSGVDDQLIQSGANLLLTFTNIRNETGKGNKVFDRATAAALDLSVKGFGSMESTSKMLGKALNDPIKGINAMSRAGVTFTAQQKEQITALTESGNLLKAQGIILAEVERQVGGSAAAFGETAAGRIGKAREAISGVTSEIVERGLPAFLDLTDSVQQSVARFDQWSGTTEGQQALRNAGAFARDAADGVKVLGDTLFDATRFLMEHRTAVTAIVAGYAGFRVATSVLTPLNAAWQLGSANAAKFAAANQGAARGSALLRGAVGALGGPIGIASLAVGGLAAMYLTAKANGKQLEDQARRNADALYEEVRAAGSVADSQLAIRSARQGIKEQAAALREAEKSVAEARKAGDGEALASALRTRDRAKITLEESRKNARDTIAAEQEKNRQTLANAKKAARELDELEKLRNRTSLTNREAFAEGFTSIMDSVTGGDSFVPKQEKRLRELEAKEKAHLKTIEAFHKQSRGVVEQVDGERVVKAGQRAAIEARMRQRWASQGAAWSSKELQRIAQRSGQVSAESNRQLEKVGAVDRGAVAANIRSSFGNISQLVQNAIGSKAINIPINFLAKFMGIGDAFDAGGLPPGVKPQLGPYAAVAQSMGLGISPGAVRPAGTRTASGGVSDHTTGNALDLAGSPSAMARFAKAARQMPRVKQVIYSPLGLSNGGSAFGPIGNAAVQRMHYSHVHVAAYQRGGFRVPGVGTGDKYPAMLEPGEVVVNKRAVRAHGGPAAFHNATNGAIPRFATGGYLAAARGAARTAADPVTALAAANQAFSRSQYIAAELRAQIANMRAGGVSKDEKARIAKLTERLTTVQSELASLADDVVSKEQAVLDARRSASEAEDAAAQARADAAAAEAELAKQRAMEARQAELDLPRTMMTLADANLELQKVMAEIKPGLEDDIQQRRDAIAAEERRQAAIEAVRARTDLTDEERAQATRDLAASLSTQNALTSELNELTAQSAAAAGGATTADLIAALRSTTQALYQMGASEAGNVFQIAELKQTVSGGGVDWWQLQTTAGLQGAVL